MKNIFVVGCALALSVFSVGCATVQGTVFKQQDGTYKASYAGSTERSVRKTIHSDAALTCKKKEKTKEFRVVEESVEKIEDKADAKGFAAVADTAVSLADKYFNVESVRGSLIFDCDK